MESLLNSYLSLRYNSDDEQRYIFGLIDQFETAKLSGSYHLALFAYHLLFICYFYQTLHKLKIWKPSQHHMAMVSFDKERREKFRNATNPADYAHNGNSESSFFEFLNVFCDCPELVKECKELVKYRNVRLGHVNYLLVSEEAFEKQIETYDLVVERIHKITHSELSRIFLEFLDGLDGRVKLIGDNIETDLIIPNKFSEKDLECLAVECLIKPDNKKKQISMILKEDFNISVDLI